MSIERRSNVTPTAQSEPAKRSGAQPLRNFQRGEHAYRASEHRAIGVKRQQKEFKIQVISIGALRGYRGHRADAFVGQNRQQARYKRPAGKRPKAEEGFSLHLSIK